MSAHEIASGSLDSTQAGAAAQTADASHSDGQSDGPLSLTQIIEQSKPTDRLVAAPATDKGSGSGSPAGDHNGSIFGGGSGRQIFNREGGSADLGRGSLPPLSLVDGDRGKHQLNERQVGPGPYDVINREFKKDSGSSHFDEGGDQKTAVSDLASRFENEQIAGTLENDPLWKSYLKDQGGEISNSQLKDMISDLKNKGGNDDLLQRLKGISETSFGDRQQQLLKDELQNNVQFKAELADNTLKSLVKESKGEKVDPEFLKKHRELFREIAAAQKAEADHVKQEHKKLDDWADKTLKEPARSKFKHNLDDFEARSRQDNFTNKDILQTYANIERITQATGSTPLSALQRQQIAEQVVQQVAHPTSISQGSHKTCNVTTIETRTYTRTPAEATRLVADVALTGQYIAGDGIKVKIDATPHDQSKTHPVPDGSRSHASEIFEVTAVNLHYARENNKNGGDIRYEQVEPNPGDKADTGERLMDYSKTPPEPVKDSSKNPIRGTDLSDDDMAGINTSLLGKVERDVILQSFGTTKDGVTAITSQDQLAAKLKDLKEHKKLPCIVWVDTNNEPFYTDSGRGTAGGSGGAHVVTVTDYDEKTGKVLVDNQWDNGVDHGKKNPIALHDLYIAMQDKAEAEKILAADVKSNRDKGIFDPAKETDLLRHQLKNGTITQTKAEEESRRIITETKDYYDKHKASKEDQARNWKEMEAIMHNMPLDAQLRLGTQAHGAKLISDEWYMKELELAGWQLAVDNKANKAKTGGPDPAAEATFQKGLGELRTGLASMNANQQKKILKQIGDWTKNL